VVFRKSLKVILIAVSVFYANVVVGYCAGITIGAGAGMTLAGSPTVATVDLTISPAAGVLGAGILNAGAATLNIKGNWSNQGTFTAGASTVNFIGGNQSINGSTTFYNFTKNVTTAATLTFDHLGTQTIVNSLILNGASLQLLSLRSTSLTVAFKIILQFGGQQSLSYLDVSYSDASGGSTLVAGATSTNSGSNTNWLFAAQTLSISVLPTSYDFGSVLEGSTTLTTSTIVVTNNGNVIETYQLKLTNPTGWTAVQTGAPGVDQYMLSAIFHGATAPVTGDFADNDALRTTYQTCSATVFAKDTTPPETGVCVEVGGERRLWFRLVAPSYSNVGTQQSITVTINATAA